MMSTSKSKCSDTQVVFPRSISLSRGSTVKGTRDRSRQETSILFCLTAALLEVLEENKNQLSSVPSIISMTVFGTVAVF